MFGKKNKHYWESVGVSVVLDCTNLSSTSKFSRVGSQD